jgi:hypothetical protein
MMEAKYSSQEVMAVMWPGPKPWSRKVTIPPEDG